MPSQCDVVIVGGGILGSACAYYLTRDTQLKVRLIDRHAPASGTTSQAAGLLGRSKSNPALLDMVDETWHAISELRGLGATIDLHSCGSLHMGSSEAARQEILACALETERRERRVEWLGQKQTKAWLPWLNTFDSRVIAFFPEDGYVDPYQLATAYLKQAKKQGAHIHLNAEVARLEHDQERLRGVTLKDGSTIYASQVVLAGGPWTSLLSRALNVLPAMAPVRSQYWVTEPNARIPHNCPIMILPDANAYARPEVGGLLFGLRDTQCVHSAPDLLPADIHGFRFSQDSDGMRSLEQGYDALAATVTLVNELNLSHYISGVSSYTPDGKFLIGPSGSLPGLWIASGCCGAGVGSSAGFGRLISELIADKTPFTDTSLFDPQRFVHLNADPFNELFRNTCALAREAKRSG